MALIATRCALEYQVADARSGRNLLTTPYHQTIIFKRRGGLEVVCEEPSFRKALRLHKHKYEVYFSHISQGKMTFIRRDSTRIYQFNLQHGDPAAMEDLRLFSLSMGAISKTPMRMTANASRPYVNYSQKPFVGVKRPRTSPLKDRTNDLTASNPGIMQSAKNQRSFSSRRRLESNSQNSTVEQHNKPARFTKEQLQVLKCIAERKNVFFTGSAGTGKSFLLQQILQGVSATREINKGRIYATATTGIAAYNIGGMTLHHFAGIDARPYGSQQELLRQVQSRKDALRRWLHAQMLVIDEISMLDGQLFDDLEAIARTVRRDNSFFGGIQLVLSGDFFQLPPVTKQCKQTTLCFESASWQRGIKEVVVLSQVFRQTNEEFVTILNAFRMGKTTEKMVARLNERYLPSQELIDGSAIHIFTHNDDVFQTNTKRLEELKGKKFNYVCADRCRTLSHYVFLLERGKKEYLAGCPAPPSLSLKQNAQVMLTKTINPLIGLVNGSRGVVQGFTSQTNLPIVRFSNGTTEIIRHEEFPVRVADTVLASRRQLPLTLAWAISIHKSQGLSFDSAVLDLSRVFEYGQAYVALSRVRSLQGLHLRSRLGFNRTILADARVLAFYEAISRK